MSMKPRVSLITLGVNDLARARQFYETGLGWKVSGAGWNEHVVFIQLAGGVGIGLFSRKSLAEDAHLPDAGSGIQRYYPRAESAGRRRRSTARWRQPWPPVPSQLKMPEDVFWGWLFRLFARSRRTSVGSWRGIRSVLPLERRWRRSRSPEQKRRGLAVPPFPILAAYAVLEAEGFRRRHVLLLADRRRPPL